jgi:hypothetical protein
MKTTAARFALIAGLVAPAFAFDVSRVAGQDVARLTLLRGPYLTSPAEPVSPPAALPVFSSAPGSLREPDPTGRLKLSIGAGKLREVTPAPKPQPPRDPNTLRFDAQLPSSTKPTLLAPPGAKPAPRPPADSAR